MSKGRWISIVTVTFISLLQWLGGIPLKAVVLSWIISSLIMFTLVESLANKLAGLGQPTSVVESPEIEAPVRCQDCGSSLWIVDRDDNGVCDNCWARKETVTFEEDQQRGIEELKQRKKLQEEIANRGLFL